MNIIAVGAVSPEVIESVYKYSHVTHTPFILTCNKEQVDYNGGYCMDTKTYLNYIKDMRSIYTDAQIMIARDHCGPGFTSDDFADTYKTIEADARGGFDLLGLDFSHYKAPRSQMIDKMAEAIKYAKLLNPRMQFEIGSNLIGRPHELGRIQTDLEFFIKHCTPLYYVLPTGSDVKEDRQSGCFYQEAVLNATRKLTDFNIQAKEYESDFLTVSQIADRKGILNSLTISHELGLTQTETVFAHGQQKDIDAFLEVSHESKKWKPLLMTGLPDDMILCGTICAHYNYQLPQWNRLIKNIGDNTNIKEKVIDACIQVLDRYVLNFSR